MAGIIYTDVCKVYHCCREKGLDHCGSCGEFPCQRLGKMGDFRDLNTGHVKPSTCAAVAENGFEAWYVEYALRAQMLAEALEKYNDGRMKRYLCELFIRQDVETLRRIMERAESLDGTAKEKGKAFKVMADAMLAEEEGGK